MMHKNRILHIVVFVSFTGVAILPVYTLFFLTPIYDNLIKSYTEAGLINLASQMIANQKFDSEISEDTVLPSEFIDEVEHIRQSVGLSKVKIFTTTGKIVYCSDPADIGNSTSKDFFQSMMLDGRPRSMLETSEESNGLQSKRKIYHVETYVPIMNGGKSIGAFEIYYDITDIHNSMVQIKTNEHRILFPLVFGLFAAVIISTYYAHKSMAELQRSKDKFKELSITDGLTGLLNRRGFIAQVKNKLSILDRESKEAFLVYIDLDNLKCINDHMGHETGDDAICDVAKILQDTFRQSDIIARIGGDEFALFTAQTDHPLQEKSIRARVDEKIAQFNESGRHKYKISLSMGFARYSPKNPCSEKELIMKADNLMYEEKCLKKTRSTSRCL